MNAVREPTQDELDAGREREIETARLAMSAAHDAGDIEAAHEYREHMYALIGQRSDAQRARMEARLPEPWRS